MTTSAKPHPEPCQRGRLWKTAALAVAVLLLGGSAGIGRASVRSVKRKSDAVVPLQPTRVLRLNNGHTLAALTVAGGQVAVTRTDGCSPIIIWDHGRDASSVCRAAFRHATSG
jgi:hypothetical protein